MALAVATGTRGTLAAVSAVVGIAQRVVQIVGTLVTMPLVLHALGTDGFGRWAAAASVAWMVGTVDFGVGFALLTAVARAQGNPAAARTEVTAALQLALLLGVAVLVAAVPAIGWQASSAAAPAYLIAAAALALNIPGSLAGSIWTGLQRAYVAWAWEAAQTVATTGGLYALTATTGDVRCYVAMTFGCILAANYASLCHLLLRYPDLRPARLRWTPGPLGALLRRGAPYVLLGLATTLAIHSDNILALWLLGPQAAGQMAVAQRACMTALGLLWVLTQPLWPAFTDAAARGDDRWLRAHIVRSAALVAACAIVGAALLVAFGQSLSQLWLGGGLTVGQGVLWAMAAWIVVPALGRVPDVLLNALGVVWFQVAVALVYSALAFALKLALAPRLGVGGILMATGIAYGCTHLPAYLWWVWRWMRRRATD
jgi:O-antigen/teichoic acid export membrane protein